MMHHFKINYFSDSPRVSIQPLAKTELTEGDSVTLHCAVSANPPAQVEWRMAGDDQPISNGERLEIPRLTRAHSGKYICQAKNSLGLSGPEKIDLSVKCKLRLNSGGRIFDTTGYWYPDWYTSNIELFQLI